MARSYVSEARLKVGPKRDRIRPVIERLAVEHADAEIALTFRNPLELLVSVMLSAQTTDVNVNRVTEKLFVKYRRPEDYLAVPREELEQDIFQTGFYRQKAKSLRGTMEILIAEHGGEVPESFDELLRLPGVARKTANVVSAERGNAQGIVVDTHVRRLSQRLGFTRQEDPVKIERDLVKLVPRAGLGALPAPADLARPQGLRRAQAGLREVRPRRPVPERPLFGRERHEQPAVVVVGGEEVGDDLLLDAGMRAQRELLAELPHAPFTDGGDRLGVGEVEGLGDVPAHHVRLLVARELEDAVPGREDARVLVADDEARRRAPGSSPRAART